MERFWLEQKHIKFKLDKAISELEVVLNTVKQQDRFFGLAWPVEDRLYKLKSTCEQILREF